MYTFAVLFQAEAFLDVAQLVAHLVRDQEVAGSSPVIQTTNNQALAGTQVLFSFIHRFIAMKTGGASLQQIYWTLLVDDLEVVSR